MTAIVYVLSFVTLPNEVVSAPGAPDHPAEKVIVNKYAGDEFPRKDGPNAVEECLGNQGFMDAAIGLIRRGLMWMRPM